MVEKRETPQSERESNVRENETDGGGVGGDRTKTKSSSDRKKGWWRKRDSIERG